MANALNDQLKEELFTLIKHRLGAPIRKIELDWDQMCSLLETSRLVNRKSMVFVVR